MKWASSVLTAVVAYFAPVHAALGAAIALVVVDLLTGLIASMKRNESFTSAKLKVTVAKTALYLVAICVAHVAQRHLTGETIPIQNLVTTVIGLTEAKSILENLDAIHGRSLWAAIIEKLAASKSNLPS